MNEQIEWKHVHGYGALKYETFVCEGIEGKVPLGGTIIGDDIGIAA